MRRIHQRDQVLEPASLHPHAGEQHAAVPGRAGLCLKEDYTIRGNRLEQGREAQVGGPGADAGGVKMRTGHGELISFWSIPSCGRAVRRDLTPVMVRLLARPRSEE